MRILLALTAFCMPVAAAAHNFAGHAVAVDGDTLEMSGERVRLHGIDAPERMQTCKRSGAAWACGRDAAALLSEMVAGRTVECTARDRDAYGRIVAACRAGASDLAGVMVREGMAIALPRYSLDYVEAEARAKGFKLALWSSEFALPADFRAASPELFKAPAPPIVSAVRATRAVRTTAPTSAYFRNCTEARAAGAAPLYRGQAGYRPPLDSDGDGIACEPYRGQG